MHFSSHTNALFISFTALLASVVSADEHFLQRRAVLVSRQDGQSQAFTPSSISKPGNTCEEAGGPDYHQCGPLVGDTFQCWNANKGESCCHNDYPCPSGSFCLVQGKCCPNGVDPASCATNFGITLPADFSTATNFNPSTSAVPSTTPAAVTTGSSETTTSSTSSIVVITSTSSAGTGTPVSYGNGTYTPTSSPEAFTGAANALKAAAGGTLVVCLGFLGLIGNVL